MKTPGHSATVNKEHIMNIAMKSLFLFVLLFKLSSTHAATQEICPGSTIPPGWVVVNQNIYGGGIYCTNGRSRTIQNSVGETSLNICANQVIPAGWLITNNSVFGGTTNCENGSITIKNTVGLSKIDVCTGQTLPTGWLVTNNNIGSYGSSVTYGSSASCTTTPGSVVTTSVVTIQNTAGLASLDICPTSTSVPPTWFITQYNPYPTSANCKLASTPIASTPISIWRIKTTEGLASLDICSTSKLLPTGWVIVDHDVNASMSSASCADATTIGYTSTIWKISNPNIVKCDLIASTNVVQPGQSYSLIITGTNIPSNATGYWYGTKNGITDATGDYLGYVPTSTTYTNNAGWQGTYTRWVQVRDPQGKTVCTTSAVTVQLLPTPTCSLSVDKTTVPLGTSYTFSVAGSDLPAGSQAYWYGSKNGVTDVSGAYMGTVPSNVTYTSAVGWTGTYSRYLEIRSGSTPVCTTNAVTVVVQ